MLKQIEKSRKSFRSDFTIGSKDSDDLWLRSLNEPLVGDIYIVKSLEIWFNEQNIALLKSIMKWAEGNNDNEIIWLDNLQKEIKDVISKLE